LRSRAMVSATYPDQRTSIAFGSQSIENSSSVFSKQGEILLQDVMPSWEKGLEGFKALWEQVRRNGSQQRRGSPY
jgi:hypothetical protein